MRPQDNLGLCTNANPTALHETTPTTHPDCSTAFTHDMQYTAVKIECLMYLCAVG